MLNLQIHVSMAQLWIVLNAVLGALDRHSPDTSSLATLHYFVLSQGNRPLLDALIQLGLVLKTALGGGEFWVEGPRGTLHELHQSPPFLV
ncbi:MAG: hypothetical protein IIB65_01095 [Proteobacteria bacterium]|nr:hypothetical protein [Pseudomonadota bacterium]